MTNKVFNPYVYLKGKEYWEVSFVRYKSSYCSTIDTIDVDSEAVAENIAGILKAQGYDEVSVEYHDKDLPF